jgi:hypothetical protein
MMSTRPWCIRPQADEVPPFYAGYVGRVPENDVLAVLETQIETTLALVRSVPEARAGSRYAPGKWSVRQVIGHLVDAERVFAFRALHFARRDVSPLPGFDENAYVDIAPFDACRLRDLGRELEHLRRANLLFFRHLDDAAWLRSGIANDCTMHVRTVAFVLAGHERHHVQTLRERYGLGPPA